MRYFLIAGEASGDLHASELIRALRNEDAEAEFRFLGGDMMERAAGVAPIIHYRDMAYMGFIEVLKHLRTILGIMDTAKKSLKEFGADALILVDYPSFNLKVAKYANQCGIPVYYFISPKVWAWKEYRVKEIRKYVKEMYCILPFEPKFYAKHDYKVEYVGNPSVQEIDNAIAQMPTRAQFFNKYNIDESARVIAIVPGSRRKEIADNMPTMLAAAKRYPHLTPVIAVAPGVDYSLYEKVLRDNGIDDVPVMVQGETFTLVRNAEIALVTSGTATLEAALLGTPQVACYRMNGSKMVYWFYSHLLHVGYVTLPNLILDAPAIPELLLHHCNVETVADYIERLSEGAPERTKMLEQYAEMRRILGTSPSAPTAATKLVKNLKNNG